MLPNPSNIPILEVLDNLAPTPLHSSAWAACSTKSWYFGHGSHGGDWSRFWKMDLDGNADFDAIWEQARPRCEALAGAPLRVIRQYANGHTYGLGGNPHQDDHRPGSFTLLYYPNPEWKDGWDGETVFYDEGGEIALAVRPRPNRAVFFDSRILHAGRAPSRLCPALRVTVAYKLEIATLERIAQPSIDSGTTQRIEETSRDGAQRTYRIFVPASVVDEAVRSKLSSLAQTVRLPGFRPGMIPPAVIAERYGTQARRDILNRLGAEATERSLPKGSVISSFELHSGAAEGDLEFDVATTYLPELPPFDFSNLSVQRLTASEGAVEALGTTMDLVVDALQGDLKLQVLDFLDASCTLPLLPTSVDRELSSILKSADPSLRSSADYRPIAERRVRLGWLIAEIARRQSIRSQLGAELEQRVVDYILSQAQVTERPATQDELRQLLED